MSSQQVMTPSCHAARVASECIKGHTDNVSITETHAIDSCAKWRIIVSFMTGT
jgi:hypothetical protein